MSEPTFDITAIFGHVEMKQFTKFENGRMYNYSYSINYDRDGKEVSRTGPVSYGSIGYDDGTAFTEDDYNEIMYGKPKDPSLFGMVRNLFVSMFG